MRKLDRFFTFQFAISIILAAAALTACTPAYQVPLPPEPQATTLPTENPMRGAETPQTTQVTIDSADLGLDYQIETVAAVSAETGAPYWEVLPAYTRLSLQGYPVAEHAVQPSIFIYPIDELKEANEGARAVVDSLQSLLQSPREIVDLPFLPLANSVQAMHTHLQYLDFTGGAGLRYLTIFQQGIAPVNNHELVYTYQGITSDGKYYVSAMLPVNHPSLPADGTITGNEPPEFSGDLAAYRQHVAASLNTQPADSFSPDLTRLDAMMSSIAVR